MAIATDSIRTDRQPAVALLIVGTLATALYLLGRAEGASAGVTAFIWFLACLGGEIFWFRTPGYDSTLSLALTLDVAAVAALPPQTALIVVGASTVIAGSLAHRRPAYRVLFNAAQSIVAAGVAALLFRVVANAGGVPESATVPTLALLTAGLTFYLINTGCVAAAVGLSSGQSPWMVWLDCYGTPLELASTLGQLSLAYFVVMACNVVGPFALVATFPVLLALWYGSAGPTGRRPPLPSQGLAD